ncbi:Ig-like domain-containing protein, partial [Atopobacter phocae]|uniref:Ig-like domain-containing protein n=1 Tax=Atopobacter phocae TaxID=136492 RepID=UPI0005587A79
MIKAKREKSLIQGEKRQRYAIRKISGYGAVSVAVSAFFMMSGSPIQISAATGSPGQSDQIDVSSSSDINEEIITVTSAETLAAPTESEETIDVASVETSAASTELEEPAVVTTVDTLAASTESEEVSVTATEESIVDATPETVSITEEPKKSLMKSALEMLIQSAKTVDVTLKSEAGKQLFSNELVKAEKIFNDPLTDQASIDASVTALAYAINHLSIDQVPASVDSLEIETLETKPQKLEKKLVAEPLMKMMKASAVPAVSEEMKIQFLNQAGTVLKSSDVINAKDGQNVRVNVQVDLPENFLNKKVEIELGNFLSFAGDIGTGSKDETVSEQTTSISTPEYTSELKTGSGEKYIDLDDKNKEKIYSTNQKVVYDLKDDLQKLIIPITLNADFRARLFGISSDGVIEGVETGVEQSTPITVKLFADKEGKKYQKEAQLDKLSIPDNVDRYNRKAGRTWATQSRLHAKDVIANTLNDYKAKINFYVGGGVGNGSEDLYFTEAITFDLVVPKGVKIVDITSSSPVTFSDPVIDGESGISRVIGSLSKSAAGKYVGLEVEVSVDRKIVKEDTSVVKLENAKIKFRNSEFTTMNNSTKRFTILDTKEGENFRFLSSGFGKPGYKQEMRYGITTEKVSNEKYTGVGAVFNYGAIITNFTETPISPKTLVYEFEENEFVDVKGLVLPLLPNNHILKTIEVKSKMKPTWKTITFDIPYSGDQVVYKDITDFGYSEADTLVGAKISLGGFDEYAVLRQAYSRYRIKNTDIFGTIKKVADKQFNVAKVHLIDTTDEMKALDSVKQRVSVSTAIFTPRLDTVVNVDSNKVIKYNKKETIKYTIKNNNGSDSHWSASSDKIDKVVLALPTDIKASNIKFYNPVTNKEFTADVQRTNKVVDDITLYEFSFKDVAADNSYVGFLGSKGSGFKDQYFTVEVDVLNDSKTNRVLSYDQSLFVVVDGIRDSVGENTHRVDKYMLAPDSRLVITNKPTEAGIVFTKADTLDITTEAKLSTDKKFKPSNSGFKITDVKQDLDIKLNISNPTESIVEAADLFIPIPKLNQNWGKNFQDKAFEFGLNLKGVVLDEAFKKTFDVSYANVAKDKLEGDQLDTTKLANEQFTKDFTKANLIRIQSKDQKNIDKLSISSITLKLELDKVSKLEDGKTIVWNPYYKAEFPSATLTEKAQNIELALTVGKAALHLFDDKNTNGKKSTDEEVLKNTNVEVEVYNESGKNVYSAAQAEFSADGKLILEGLITDKKYRVKLTSKDKMMRFTTGKKNKDASITNINITAEAVTLSEVKVSKEVGMIKRLQLVDPTIILVDDSESITPTEITEVINAVKETNKDLPQETIVTVDTKGNVTIKYQDGYSDTIDKGKTIKQKDTTKAGTVNPIDTDDIIITGTGTTGSTVKVTVTNGTQEVTVVDGKWSVDIKDPLKAGDKVTVVQTAPNKLPSDEVTETVKPTTADKVEIKPPAPTVKVPVDNITEIQQDEKDQVIDEVVKANPGKGITKDNVSVGDDGTVTVTYPDKSTDTLTPGQVVIEKTQPGT